MGCGCLPMIGIFFLLAVLIGLFSEEDQEQQTAEQKTKVVEQSEQPKEKQEEKKVEEEEPKKETVKQEEPKAEPQKCLKIKGNISSSGEKIYHVPSGSYYDITEPEQTFCTEQEAINAGFRKSKR